MMKMIQYLKEMKRQLRNTIDNLGNRCINELLKFSNPTEMVNSNSQFAMLELGLSDGQKALKAINDYYTQIKVHQNLYIKL